MRMQRESPARVVMFQGCQPSVRHLIWHDKDVELVLWIGAGLRGKDRIPKGWRLSRKRVSHNDLGGVTDGCFTLWRALKIGASLVEAKTLGHYPNTLRQVMDPTQSGRKCDIPEPRPADTDRNSVDSLLAWTTRHRSLVRTPTVFSKTHWVSRRLTCKEMSQVLDLPGARLRSWSEAELQRIVKTVQVPGKVVSHLVAWENTISDEPVLKEVDSGKRKRKTENEGGQDSKLETLAVQKRVTFREPLFECMEQTEGPPEAQPAETKNDKGEVAQSSTVSAKAVKADDASVPIQLWDERLISGFTWLQVSDQSVKRALKVLRRAALRYWKRKVARDFGSWFADQQARDPKLDKRSEVWHIGRRAIGYAWSASWWEWTHGSHLFFWRWPKFYQEEARIGIPPRFDSAPPENEERQPPYQDESNRLLVKSKVGKVVYKGYIAKGYSRLAAKILAYMFMFDVPKGPTDVRIVYDGSKSGLNEALWSPWFALPTVDTMTRTILPDGWCADNDYGEQFLNFPLHPKLQKYCGVDLSQLYPEESESGEGPVVGRWTRSAMGLKVSPYNAVQGALVCKLVILKDHKNPKDPFHWKDVILNLPGSEGYRADLPWIYKVREDGTIACDIHQYIDDLRITGAKVFLVWQASSKTAKTCAWLGLQDAARKRREPSQAPGAWAGATVSTDAGGVFKSVTQERWEKTQSKIRWLAYQVGLWDEVSERFLDRATLETERKSVEEGKLEHKIAESHRGFLIYVSRTFKSMVPYLKGLHLTLDSWREGRDDDGWKDARAAFERRFTAQTERIKAPKMVKMVSRFKRDMEALMELTKAKTPPKIRVRPQQAAAVFLVGDASGSGFGDSTWEQGSKRVKVAHGAWTSATSKESSNYREAYNLILHLERMLKGGEIKRGSEVFIFTDNVNAERTFYKGSSKSRLLHEMALKLRVLEMRGDIMCHFVWIPGTRMIAQGTDGLSRGDMTSGVMNGEDFLRHIPLNESIVEREPLLINRLLESVQGDWEVMCDPKDWYTKPFQFDQRGQGLVWCPPPCIAEVALEQLCEAFHVFPHSSHIFICPALMTGQWRKQLGKVSDVMLTLPAGSEWWPSEQHEPIVIALICPLLPHSPWRVKRHEWVDVWEHQMRELWRQDSSVVRDCMREFWDKSRH